MIINDYAAPGESAKMTVAVGIRPKMDKPRAADC